MRAVIRRILERQGYTVLEARDGATALRVAGVARIALQRRRVESGPPFLCSPKAVQYRQIPPRARRTGKHYGKQVPHPLVNCQSAHDA